MPKFECGCHALGGRFIMHDQPECTVDINDRMQVVIEPDEKGNLQLRIYPKTNGEYWDNPFCVFSVDIAEIEQLEKEMEE